MRTMNKDVIVIGAGAAGLLCAIEAGKRGRSVVVLEREDRIGKKIAISGGGRCNFTNLSTDPIHFLSSNPDFHKSALARFTPSDFVALVERHGIAYHEKKLGQLFCDQSSSQIIEMLQQECKDAGVEIVVNCDTRGIANAGSFSVDTSRGVMKADSLVIATGGLSIPKIGATDFAYRVAAQFGLETVPTRPGLVPLLWNGSDGGHFGRLSGVSLDALVRCGSAEFRENILFTHRGVSGPAILQISSYWREGDSITIDLLPDADSPDLLAADQKSKIELTTFLGRYLPRRFALKWCDLYGPSKPMNQYSRSELVAIAAQLHQWKIRPVDTEGYGKAEVTLGGIDTRELSSKSMEARKVPGLFFIGECVDVTGHLGGHNFQWAWASGFAAGQYV